MDYPIIFLDIDHVLTNTDVDDTSYLNYDPSKYSLSEYNLKNLDKILDASGAKIVIASNWRRFVPPRNSWLYNGKHYMNQLPKFRERYSDYIIDDLPHDRYLNKSEALELWCEYHCENFSKAKDRYLILEDDIREGYQDNVNFRKHLVLTDYHYGLSENDVKKSFEILGISRKDI
jgi:hypothetical protein